MLSWKEAHRLAVVGAARALKGTDQASSGPVDLLAIADKQGIVVNYMPIPSLAGAYVAETSVAPPGIMINTRLPLSKQRYTLGHELGHHFFEHGNQTDRDVDLFAGSVAGSGLSNEEKVAEAFAAWVLMPRRRVAAATELLRCGNGFTPELVYRLSLLLGASYLATATHLSNVAQLPWRSVEALKKAPPKRIKAALLGETPINPGRRDVHVVDPAHLPRHDVQAGDVLTLASGVATVFDPDLLRPPDSVVGDHPSYLTVQSSDPVNPIRPTTTTQLHTSVGVAEICIHHPLQGVSERWFE